MLNHSFLAACGLTLMAATAHAHATLEQAEATVGATTKITLRVPHGCEGEATHTVRIEIPEGFYAVKPMPKPGWALETEIGAYETPYDNHGTMMTEGVRAVVWSGGDLADAHYDEFVLRGSVGKQFDGGEVIYFPAVQTCANGVADWTDTSGAPDVPNPAPKLTLVAADGADAHAHAGHAGHGMADKVTLGALEITAPAAAATLPNQPVAGGFVTITNTGAEDDVLVGASSAVAGRIEVHEMAMEGDVMKMRALAEGLAVPAGETVTLKPGGYHIMFMDLAGPMEAGTSAEVELEFRDAGKVVVTFPVKPRDEIGAGGHAHGGHGHSGHEGN
ncbi:DUF1775 domain-containing protein [Vannielia litorea]|uniref:YncI copper-binding domain-containing protein n=1 Tax=Vannielia litorea TaxID=1217970 RepID=A0A1N6HQS3_9RHOB|nr:DUF1775 domain-containing protein [Vannielia litorea]SIO22025.1 hypothetical protein SAMN05444002_3596 [Vannielia litorea]